MEPILYPYTHYFVSNRFQEIKIYKNVFPREQFFENMFSFDRESQKYLEIMQEFQHAHKLGKFTKWLKNNVVCAEITNNIRVFVLGQKNHYV